MERQAHWVKENKQERMPPRMVVFDTESRSHRDGDSEIQTWRVGCAIRWRTDLKSGDRAEASVFETAWDLWEWITGYCKKGTRTVAWAHNLGHDVRISGCFTILPQMGFTLEWCNLDRNVSAMVWRSDHGTLVLADTWTWVPLALSAIGPMVNSPKFAMPKASDDDDIWAIYCMQDVRILYRVVWELVGFIQDQHLGNWQPTGAGMAYATWRHRFLSDKVLVHDDSGALEAERAAMHTGRAEAWRHGLISGVTWTEVDMSNAYLTIARECELPRKLRLQCGRITLAQYRRLAGRNRVLCSCRIRTASPVVPAKVGGRILWPVGEFDTWLWDTEVDCALRHGASVSIHKAYVYARAPILREWAIWCSQILSGELGATSPVVRTWVKHTARALIGRIALKTRSWELFGSNPDGITGITRLIDREAGTVSRLMHVGDLTMIETDEGESKDSIPMVTSWVMAECRVRLWEAMTAAGLDHLAHVDTDSLLVDPEGLTRLETVLGEAYRGLWHVKGSWRTIDVYGPRRYLRGRERVLAGIPGRAERVTDTVYRGEKWASASSDLETLGDGVVTTRWDTWTLRRDDPRRRDATGASGRTEAYEVGAGSVSMSPSSPRSGAGE